MKFRRITKGFLSVILTLTMLAGMLPLSVFQVSADTKTEYIFKNATDWAAAGGGGHYYNYPATFVYYALREHSGAYNSRFTSKLATSYNADSLANEIVSAGAKKYTNTSYQDYDILVTGSGSMGFLKGSTVYYASPGTSSAKTVSLSFYTNPSTSFGGVNYYLRYVETIVYDTAVDVGDDFYAYINVVGTQENQYARALTCGDKISSSDGTTVYNVKIANPDLTDQRQVWHFQKVTDSDGISYLITNAKYTKCALNTDGGVIAQKRNVQASNWWSSNSVNDTFKVKLIENTNNITVSVDNTTAKKYYLKFRAAAASGNAEQALNADTGSSTGNVHLYDKSVVDGSSAFVINKITTVPNGTNAVINCVKNTSTRMAVNLSDNNVLYKTSTGTVPDDTQVWVFEKISAEGVLPPIYRIKNRKNNKYLQVSGTNAYNNNVTVGDLNEASNDQKWAIMGTGSDRLQILSLRYTTNDHAFPPIADCYNNSLIVLESPGANTADGQSIRTYANNLSDAQSFTLSRYWVDKGDFYSTIKSNISLNDSNYGLSISKDGKNLDGLSLGDDICAVALRQFNNNVADLEWHFISNGDGTYFIKNMANGYYLYYDNAASVQPDTQASKNVALRAKKELTRSNAEKWYIIQELNGNYSLSCKAWEFTKVLDIFNGQIIANTSTDQTNLRPWTFNSSLAQTWQFDFANKTAPAETVDMGETFWANISPVQTDNSDKYLKSGNTVNTQKIYFNKVNDEAEKEKQDYVWKFVRNKDGSYSIYSCTQQNSLFDKNGGSESYNKDQYVHNWTNADDDYGYSYWRRWFIRKYADGYMLQSKQDGKVLTINSASNKDADFETDSLIVKNISTDDNRLYQLFNFEEADLTVSGEMPYVKMYLYNYGRAINSAKDAVLPFTNGSDTTTNYVDTAGSNENYWAGKNIKPSMSSTLVNGYPYVTNNNFTADLVTSDHTERNRFVEKSGSLKYLFDDTKSFVAGTGSANSYKLPSSNYQIDSDYQSQTFKVNSPASLFQKDSNNLYYYDSLLNAAYFERDTDVSGKQLTTGDFKLYDYTLSVANDTYESKSGTVTGIREFNGNFYPFNIGHVEGNISYQSSAGSTARPTVPTTNEYVTAGDPVPVNYTASAGNPTDCWFGMSLENTLVQTSDGTYNGTNLQFKFTGDDDVWVYVDGILVLDIGGTHIAQSGTIDFATGTVIDPTGTKTLKSIYKKVVDEKGSFTYNGVTIDQTYIDNNFRDNTFKGDTKHTLNFYIMERAGGHSYCQLKFNLPKGSVAVTNDVTGLDSDFSDPREYTYQLQDANGNPFTSKSETKLSEITYIYDKADGTSEQKTMAIGGTNDCKFTLKGGETVTFQGIPNGDEYKVVQIDKPNENITTTSKVTRGANPTEDYQNGKTASVNTNTFSQITYYNAIQTDSLKVVKKVTDPENPDITSMPNSTYYVGLHIFEKDSNGEIFSDYGTKKITIPGSQVGVAQEISGLPKGASYELYEYMPDDTVNRYDVPTFTDEADDGIKDYKGRLVEKDSTPALNDGISGTVNGQNVNVVNGIVRKNYVSVTFKYYDREMISGKPININYRESSYSVMENLTDEYYKNEGYVNSDNEIVVDKGKQLLSAIIINAGADTAGTIGNVVDTYELFTSQEAAVSAVAGKKTYTLGDVDNYATHTIKKEEAVYHTNSQRQPITNKSEQEKWVTYYMSGEAVDAESISFTDYSEITNITVWLYNTPRVYTVTTHVPNNGTGAVNGKDITYKAYYNQQLGVYSGNNLDECYDYCEKYSIPLADYDTRGSVEGAPKDIVDLSVPETFGGQEFSCWRDKDNNVLSTNLSYIYRVTGDSELFANYGDSVGKGIVSSDGGIDVYYDTSGKKRLRINTIMNPYGFEFGTDRGNSNIKYAAAAYLTLNSGVTTEQVNNNLADIQQQIQSKAQSIVETMVAEGETNGSGSFDVTGIGKINVVVYDTKNGQLLTNKNRLQFMAGFSAPTDSSVKTVLAFTSLYYYDRKDANSGNNKWYVSNNYVQNVLTSDASASV